MEEGKVIGQLVAQNPCSIASKSGHCRLEKLHDCRWRRHRIRCWNLTSNDLREIEDKSQQRAFLSSRGLLCNVGPNLRRWQRNGCASSSKMRHSFYLLWICALLALAEWEAGCNHSSHLGWWCSLRSVVRQIQNGSLESATRVFRKQAQRSWPWSRRLLLRCLDMTKFNFMVHVKASFKMFWCVVRVADRCSVSPSSSEKTPPVGSLPVPPMGTVAPRRRHGNCVYPLLGKS